MLVKAFEAILITSVMGSALALALYLLNPITKKVFSHNWNYYIWIIVLFIFVFPVRINIDSNDIQTTYTATENNTQNAPFILSDKNTTNLNNQQTISQNIENNSNTLTFFDKVKTLVEDKVVLVSIIWIVGLVITLLTSLLSYLIYINRIKRNSIQIDYDEISNLFYKKIRIYKSKNVCSPFVIGLFKPTLILPEKAMTEKQLSYVLKHETTHVKRKDILYKWVATLVKCIHWFNPLIYFVVKRINIECEISCDLNVVKNMSSEEETNYMNTILSLLPNDNQRYMPVSTGMANNTKILKRRFKMIKNKKYAGKVVTLVSVIIALLILTTTVFASGILSDTVQKSDIVLKNNGKAIELSNKAFINNDEIYLPLRECFEKLGIMSNKDSKIVWDNGTIEVSIAIDNEKNNYSFTIGEKDIVFDPRGNIDNPYVNSVYVSPMENAPILKRNLTYIPYSYLERMLKSEEKYNIEIFNKGKIISGDETEEDSSQTNLANQTIDASTPEKTVNNFFAAFADENYELMKKYCTQSCIDTFFKENSVFGIKKAVLTNLSISDKEYLKSSMDFNVFVDIDIEPAEISAFDKNQKSTSFYVYLLRQSDGSYFVNSFGN